MRIDTVKTEVFTFDELTPEAQQKAIESNREIEVSYDGWHDCIIDDWHEKLENMGFMETEINYTGFWSQGDGASFTAKSIDLWKLIKYQKMGNKYKALKKIINEEELTGEVYRETHHYYHEKTISVSLEINECTTKIGQLVDELEKELDILIEDLSGEIYKDLNNYHDELTSDEYIRERLLDSDDMEFTEDGKNY